MATSLSNVLKEDINAVHSDKPAETKDNTDQTIDLFKKANITLPTHVPFANTLSHLGGNILNMPQIVFQHQRNIGGYGEIFKARNEAELQEIKKLLATIPKSGMASKFFYSMTSDDLLKKAQTTVVKTYLVSLGGKMGLTAFSRQKIQKDEFLLMSGVLQFSEQDGICNDHVAKIISIEGRDIVVNAKEFRGMANHLGFLCTESNLLKKFKFNDLKVFQNVARANFSLRSVWLTDLELPCLIAVALRDIEPFEILGCDYNWKNLRPFLFLLNGIKVPEKYYESLECALTIEPPESAPKSIQAFGPINTVLSALEYQETLNLNIPLVYSISAGQQTAFYLTEPDNFHSLKKVSGERHKEMKLVADHAATEQEFTYLSDYITKVVCDASPAFKKYMDEYRKTKNPWKIDITIPDPIQFVPTLSRSNRDLFIKILSVNPEFKGLKYIEKSDPSSSANGKKYKLLIPGTLAIQFCSKNRKMLSENSGKRSSPTVLFEISKSSATSKISETSPLTMGAVEFNINKNANDKKIQNQEEKDKSCKR